MLPGLHTFQVRARDAAGNIDPTPATRSFRVLTQAEVGLVVSYAFDGDGADQSGRYDALALPNVSWVAGIPGSSGQAAQLDGSAWVEIPTDALNGLPSGTATAWVKAEGPSASFAILDKRADAETQFTLGLADGRLAFALNCPSAPCVHLRGTTPFRAGTWYRVAASWDGTNWKLYVNGRLESSQVSTATLPMTFDRVFVGAVGGASGFMTGAIDDLRIYDRVLPLDEIRALVDSDGSQSPVTHILTGPADGSTQTATSTTFTWTGTDDSTAALTYAYRLDGGTETQFGSGTTATFSGLALGTHTFEVRAKDSLDNIESRAGGAELHDSRLHNRGDLVAERVSLRLRGQRPGLCDRAGRRRPAVPRATTSDRHRRGAR